MQFIRILEDKKLLWRLNVNRCLFGLLSETNHFSLFHTVRRQINRKQNTMESYAGSSSAERNIFTQTRPKMISESCKYILDFAHPPKWTNILRDKNISTGVHKCF